MGVRGLAPFYGRRTLRPPSMEAAHAVGRRASYRPVRPNSMYYNEPLMRGSLFVGVYNGDRSIGAANLRKGFTPSMAGAPCAPLQWKRPCRPPSHWRFHQKELSGNALNLINQWPHRQKCNISGNSREQVMYGYSRGLQPSL